MWLSHILLSPSPLNIHNKINRDPHSFFLKDTVAMPKSMCQQALVYKERVANSHTQTVNRQRALQLLKDTNMSRSISNATSVPKSTISLIKQKWKKRDMQGLHLMLTAPNKRGRSTVLRQEEEGMIVERIKVAAARGFAIDYDEIRNIMSRIAADGRPGWKNGIPCFDTIRAFRARHRDITCKKSESKEHVKLKAENFDHVETFFSALESVDKLHPGILQDPNCVWNMDETAVSAIEGNKTKVFSGVDTHHGGFRGTSTAYGINKHITAVVAVSASGLKAPPFFIVAGKKLSSRWLQPVTGSFGRIVSGICSRFTRPNWFPTHGVIKLSENGSMEIPVMSAFAKNVNNYVRQYCKDDTYLLCLDGHSSRKGVEWIEECMSHNCEAVVSPANTSHFLQACDQAVNKRFKEALRDLRDEFCKLGTVDTKQVNFNLACGVYAYESISAQDIVNSFRATGLFPSDRSFPLRFQSDRKKTEKKAEETWQRIEKAGPGSRMNAVLLRRSDNETIGEVHKILQKNTEAYRQIQQLSILLKNAETTNNILMSVGSGRSAECSTAKSDNVDKAVMLDAGAPAEWVTVGEVLQKRKEKEAEEREIQFEKEQEKAHKAAERLKRIEREKAEKQRKEDEKFRKRFDKEAKKHRKMIEAVEKERLDALKKVSVEQSKMQAKKAKEEAKKLSVRAAAVWSIENSSAKRRGCKRDLRGTKKSIPYARSFQYAASIVVEALEAATSGSKGGDVVPNQPIFG